MHDEDGYAEMEIRGLVVWDYLVFAAVLVISAGIGVFHAFRGGKQKTTAEFLLADRKMRLLPVAISILVSGMSAILILGSPAEMYTAGTMFMMKLLSFPLSLIGINLFIPLFHPLKLTSAFEYLELRFNSKAVKRIATLQLICAQVLYMGVASFAPSTALEAVTGFPAWATIVICMCVATFYTTVGGLKAVVWTDVFQSVIMLAGMLAILIQGSIEVGGFSEVWRLNTEWDRVEFFDFNPDPTIRHTFWSLVFGGFLGFVGGMGTSQVAVQRYSALPTVRDAQKASVLNIIMAAGLILISCLTGVVLFAFYAKKGCDPLSNGYIDNSNQLVPFFVMDVLGYPGLPGLFLAAIFSGALSSISSSLSALSAVTWDAFFQDWCSNLKESYKALITKGLVVVFGALGVGVAFAAQFLSGTVLQASLSFSGAAYGPQLGLYILAGFFPWANWIGCIAGGLSGLVMALWLVLGAYFHRGGPTTDLLYPNASCPIQNITDSFTTTMIMDTTTTLEPEVLSAGLNSFYSISYLYYTSFGGLIAVVVGLAVSFATGATDPRDVDPKYLVPFFDRLCCCFPESWREKLRCGIKFRTPQEIEREENEKVLVIIPDENGSTTKHDSSLNMDDGLSRRRSGSAKVSPILPRYKETDLHVYAVSGNHIHVPDGNQKTVF